ncbi:hypothetical protein HBI56_207180 [Parastagonospora nodorum]|uniref:Uncharacterized protein n=1 Tax=Phaeosphaeria nodorum (strain SN15 / ATCC MYA-4574 / FGSC 10173) TaxID=321614 RepID=A0A7U2NP65_PHANO|nr:hypothetical protein HBH56_217820 [Parastagonospora nodorum]QRD05445.1 hypothetical protein JI435_422470 [Parastagonospora nodorum SN15]KAH3922767.1 hypothetical protein HBH54_219680 [Parastagonospora nodorum]KAH3941131.1 hypothetical protein HBH53_205910 [Parastagonospora nodorum]KAH3958099.1 hypothetical protein HBH51_214200 [Parastagonospora nodorum]
MTRFTGKGTKGSRGRKRTSRAGSPRISIAARDEGMLPPVRPTMKPQIGPTADVASCWLVVPIEHRSLGHE